ncbi:MAG: methyltransferase domain-containing protein [Actinomycetota bacterium]
MRWRAGRAARDDGQRDEGPRVEAVLDQLGPWYHRIQLGNGLVTPGTRDQSLVFELYADHLPDDLTDVTVLDLGANAAGLSVEFARRGARVVAVELGVRYLEQAAFVLERLGLTDRVELRRMDVYRTIELRRRFDIVCYVGLSYHLRYPQLALDLLSGLCEHRLLVSSQTIPGNELRMLNRAARLPNRNVGELHGWEPTEQLFLDMVAHAGFRSPRLVSTAPHAGETAERICGNRSYFVADAASTPHVLPFIDAGFVGKPEQRQ